MAKTKAVWGIELGQSTFKALRCREVDGDPTRVEVDAFDYIEYATSLNDPEVDGEEILQDALTKFLSRNKVKGDRVAISVPGHAGLARFIKLPPVESSKVPDIVKYEARQQIPFPLEEVVWDYQQMAGGAEEEGFLLECEVGLFAMKRDQVLKALEPFQHAGVEVDLVQLAPLSLYNFLTFDQMSDLPAPEEYDPDDPPESIVMLSMGSEASDLVITNGFRVWQRPIPLGGNHFTKALMKELDLTFAKAEHLKRNATQSSDPKVVFQAMRGVFSELVTECQRSISHYMNLDKSANITKILAVGNVMKLPGIRTFLQQNLG
ncbi:MAG: pilus assembly protein PilM, partial [Planctomycetales bacterium]